MTNAHAADRLNAPHPPAAGAGPHEHTPRCVMPWQQLMIDAAGDVQPCAYRGNYTNISARPSLGNINDASLDAIWNGDEARHVRRRMAAGDLEGAGCAGCLAVRQGQPLQLDYDPTAFADAAPDTPYRENIELKRREIAGGEEVLRSRPTILHYTPSHHCNLHCTHCYQNPERTLAVRREDAAAEVLALTPFLTDIVAGGGEPLILPTWRRFLANYAKQDNPHLRFSTTTNATVLRDDVVRDLRKFGRLNLIVSLDGATRETFEHVRRFSHWAAFETNATSLKELARGREGSAFAFNISVMKSNIKELPLLVDYCREREVGFNYQPVVAYPSAESLRCFNDPALEMAGWKAAINRAQAALPAFFATMAAAGQRGELTWSGGFAAIYHGHVEALWGLIPWDLLQTPHARIVARLPAWARPLARDATIARRGGRVPRSKLIGFFPVLEKGFGEVLHYAPLDAEGRFAVSLPNGVYGISVTADDSILAAPQGELGEVRARVVGGALRFARPPRLIATVLRRELLTRAAATRLGGLARTALKFARRVVPLAARRES